MTWIARISIAILITFSLAALAGTGLFFNVSSSDLTLTISTVVPNHTYPAAGIKINTPGYSLANVGTECTNAGNGYCLFSVSNNTPKTISITGSTGQVDLTLCLNGTGTLSCQNYTVTVNNTPPPLTASITATFSSSPNGIPPITSVAIGNDFYISYTQSGTGSNTVSATLPSGMSFASASNCTVSESAPTCGIEIAVSSSATAGNYTIVPTVTSGNATITSLPSPFTIFVGSPLAYVSDNSSNLWQCPMSDGVIGSNCTALTNSTDPQFGSISNATFATFSSTPYAYVSDNSNEILWQCQLDDNGNIVGGACNALSNSTSPGFESVYTATFASFSGVTYLYVSDQSSNLWQCQMDDNGNIVGGACTALTNATHAFNSTSQTAFASFSGTTYAYVSDQSQSLWKCPMDSTGNIVGGACTALINTTFPGFSNIYGQTFATFGGVTYLYVSDQTSIFWQCQMDSNGDIAGGMCTDLGVPSGSGLLFGNITYSMFVNFSGTSYGYLSNAASFLIQCTMNTSGGINGTCAVIANNAFPGFSSVTSTTFYIPS